MFNRVEGGYVVAEGEFQGTFLKGSTKEGGFCARHVSGCFGERKRTRQAALEAIRGCGVPIFSHQDHAEGIDTEAKRRAKERSDAATAKSLMTTAADQKQPEPEDGPILEQVEIKAAAPSEETVTEEETETPKRDYWALTKRGAITTGRTIATILATLLYPIVRLGGFSIEQCEEGWGWMAKQDPRERWMVFALLGLGLLTIFTAFLHFFIIVNDALEQREWRYTWKK